MRSHLIIGLAIAAGLFASKAHAQEKRGPLVAEEHRYFFRCQNEITEAQEKQFTEVLRGSDPELVVSIDRGLQAMRVLAQRPLDMAEVVSLAAQFQMAISPERTIAARTGTYDQQH